MKVNIHRLYQKINNLLIVKLVFPSLFLLFSFKPGEDGIQKLPVVKKEFKVESTFKNIRIEGNISLVLTNDPAGTVIIEGKEKELDKIRPTVENDILIIDGSRMHLFAKITVYLSATALQNIELNGDGTISSFEFIQSDHLHISLNGCIKVKVKTMGQLTFDAPDDIELSGRPPVLKRKN